MYILCGNEGFVSDIRNFEFGSWISFLDLDKQYYTQNLDILFENHLTQPNITRIGKHTKHVRYFSVGTLNLPWQISPVPWWMLVGLARLNTLVAYEGAGLCKKYTLHTALQSTLVYLKESPLPMEWSVTVRVTSRTCYVHTCCLGIHGNHLLGFCDGGRKFPNRHVADMGWRGQVHSAKQAPSLSHDRVLVNQRGFCTGTYQWSKGHFTCMTEHICTMSPRSSYTSSIECVNQAISDRTAMANATRCVWTLCIRVQGTFIHIVPGIWVCAVGTSDSPQFMNDVLC